MGFEKLNYYEFFAGVGMARAGLGGDWQCLFANDSDKLKCKSYSKNWAGDHFDPRDVAEVRGGDLAGLADLAWASFPCQDLSQAGAKAGLGEAGGVAATRSGAVWPFLQIIRGLAEDGRHPVLLALENVVGLLSANGGSDFRSLCEALGDMGYRFGAVVADAAHFVPQSRPRVFIIAVRREVPIPAGLQADMPQGPWHSQTLLRARAGLSPAVASNWIWWAPGAPPASKKFELEGIIDLTDRVAWNSNEATDRLIGMMSQSHLNRLEAAKTAGRPMIGSLYLRMRPTGENGNTQRAEIAFGSTLGCLRTPKGGASRPRIIVVEGERVRTRLLTVDEAAQLMGLDEDFILPETYNECFRLIGDGVVPAVVRFLADRLLEPLAHHAKAFVSGAMDRKASA
ncbi:DNA (cytosine-5)-methyltransferase 1 [Sphingomonas sp. SORGH_AS870]|uniref:DNA cytosine methyltransferase n=1 Tax=Sphingomonas sp. SORGH_AS_0870 TaxID=3041801 RepID=UPI0028669AEF|nr:DNA cytosine methyltransferase [Sphingomonas sp. SORGH_AS_0870]MDR6145973.1 DNA (cytosine-5)-methyltransferase 1 [Sphingomonas sp. SORGH_AS_0870]